MKKKTLKQALASGAEALRKQLTINRNLRDVTCSMAEDLFEANRTITQLRVNQAQDIESFSILSKSFETQTEELAKKISQLAQALEVNANLGLTLEDKRLIIEKLNTEIGDTWVELKNTRSSKEFLEEQLPKLELELETRKGTEQAQYAKIKELQAQLKDANDQLAKIAHEPPANPNPPVQHNDGSSPASGGQEGAAV